MKELYGDCFRCDPSPRPLIEKPWDWSVPRALCNAHMPDLEMEDGLPLQAVLDRVRPKDYQLEGSPLGKIFNPVFYREGGARRRAWVAFIAGGLMGLHDRFDATDYFQFWTLEAHGCVDLLYGLRSLPPDKSRSMLDIVIGAGARERSERPDLTDERLRGLQYGIRSVTNAWNFELRLRNRRKETGRLWPESNDELMQWLQSHPADDMPSHGTEGALLAELRALALRRFPDGARSASPWRQWWRKASTRAARHAMHRPPTAAMPAPTNSAAATGI